MKKVSFLLLILLFSSLPLFSTLLEFKKNYVLLENKGILFEISYNKFSFETDYFSYGDIARSGLFRKIQNPYINSNLTLETNRYIESSKIFGSAFYYEGFSLFYFFGLRNGLGLSIDFPYLNVSLIYALDEKIKYKVEEDLRKEGNLKTIYLLFNLDIPYFKSNFIISSFPNLLTSFFVELEAYYSILSAFFRIGNTLSLYERNESYRYEYGFKIGNSKTYFEYSYKQGEKPIYNGEYQTYEEKIKAYLNLDYLLISSESKEKVSKKGVKTRVDKIQFEFDYINFGFTTGYGYHYTFRYSFFTLSYKNGEYSNSIQIPFLKDNYKVILTLTSKPSFEISGIIIF